ncbi:glycerophosphoryl diester phosphodiesterase membrane domain-containing protein [Demequina zhanjiangensis]|uniref:Glycerophosphoryl diester phosphodiesterase membrane domain-containing protein n=1 Tax=Demequina zhanjiangensis TaxID=3051659 RepID=A0ABT8FXZ3_9MICO|nr:glycerophosphoryl diester phosphodiesterase membrane domain-containing protein [Demequina sp. SYSU T00b26]MDN4471687.1 glycerophosphoryl diester phosphodiesterase membrane domain-containing protein [Demequina sp. SYSU T00b26]
MSDSGFGSAGTEPSGAQQTGEAPVFASPSGAAPSATPASAAPGAQAFPAPPAPPTAGTQPGYASPNPAPPAQHAHLDAAAMLRPGIIPLRPLTFGELLDGPLKAIRHNPKVMIGLNALVALASMIVMYGLGFGYYGSLFSMAEVDAVALEDNYLGVSNTDLALMVLGSFLGALVLLLSTAITSLSFSRSVLNERMAPGEAFRRGLRATPALIAQSLLLTIGYSVIAGAVTLVVAGGFIADTGLGVALLILGLIAAGVVIAWLSVKVSLAVPAVVLERRGPIAALRRSWELTQGRFWMILGVLVVAIIITSLIQQVIAMPAMVILPFAMFAASSTATVLYVVVMALMSFVGVLISIAYLGGVTAGLYTDQRMRQEAFDLTLVRTVQERASAQGWGA